MSLQCGELQPTNGWDRFTSLEHLSKFQRVSLLASVTAMAWLNGSQPNFARYCLLGWYTIYTFSGALLTWHNFARCKIHFTSKSCVLLYWQRYCTALQQRAWPKLCGRGTRNGMTELSQRVRPIFGRAAITFGIGPHSSFIGSSVCIIKGWYKKNVWEHLLRTRYNDSLCIINISEYCVSQVKSKVSKVK